MEEFTVDPRDYNYCISTDPNYSYSERVLGFRVRSIRVQRRELMDNINESLNRLIEQALTYRSDNYGDFYVQEKICNLCTILQKIRILYHCQFDHRGNSIELQTDNHQNLD